MNYPLISEYVEAIKAAEDNFEQLKHLRPVWGEDGEPVMTSGNFAVVFKMKDEQTGKLHAVKCFLKEQEGRAEAYRQIAEELEFVSSTFLTPIKYLDKELFVDSANSEDSEFPVLLMDWVEGQTLDKYIREHIDDQYELSLLAYQFSRLAMWLMPQPFAHGDLKPDNILVKEDGTLVLVDYDGMYVPAMKGQKARELGSPDFRHPGRTEEVFDDHIDDFSLASILLSLKAIALQPLLLEEYGASDRLLFSEKDYRNLSDSSALGALQPLMQDAELASLYSLYILALSQNNLSQVSFRLFNLSRPDKSQYEEENLSTEVTEEDLANAWTDEYGVKYSKDKKRLLRVTREIKEEYFILKDTCVICDYAFSEEVRYCNSTVVLNNSVKKIGKYSFSHCSGFYICKLPEKLEEIGDYAFYGTGIKHLAIPQSVVSIGNYAFANCTYLETIAVSDKVPCCGENAFTGCPRLSTIFVPIGKRDRIELMFPCFRRKYYEMKLHNIESTYANKVDWTAIWTDEFGVKYSIDKKRLLKAPKDIEEYAIKEGTRVICDDAFEDCKSLRNIVFSDDIEHIGKNSFNSCKQLSNLNIPENLISIGDDAFYGCESLTSIEIPSKVEKIGEHPLRYCSKMKSISVNPKNPVFDSRDNCNAVIDTKTNTLVIGCSSTTIPDSITSIGCDAFTRCYGLNKIDIPNSITCIDEFAFSGCINLVSINLSNALDSINSHTFSYCTNLEFIVIPNNIKYLYDGAFSYCEALVSIIVPNSTKAIGVRAFEGCKNLLSFKFEGCVERIGKGVFDKCNKLANIYVPVGARQKYENMLPEFRDIIMEQDSGEEICLAYCSEDSKACEDKEYALWQPHSKIIKKNGKLGVVIDDGTTKKQIIPFNYDTWFNYDGYETDIRENFFDDYLDYIGYFAIKNSDSTFTIHGYDKDGTLTTSFTCEKFNPDSYSLHGKYILRYPKDEVEYDDIRRMRMDCDTYSDTSYLAFRKGNKWSLKSNDLKTTYIDFLECDGFGNMYWTPKGYFVEIKKSKMSQICLCKKNTNPLIFPDKYDYVSLRYFGISQNSIDSVCFEIRRGDKLAVCSNDLQNISPFIFDSVGRMINSTSVIVYKEINNRKVELVYNINGDNAWNVKDIRTFNIDEIEAVKRAEVVPSQFGNSVCFFMKSGGQTYIPLYEKSSLTPGDVVDLKTALFLTLCRKGNDDIYRVME